MKTAWRDDIGQSVVELALILPLFIGILLGGTDLARAFAVQLAVQNAARAGAESYAIDQTPTPNEAAMAAINELVRTPTVQSVLTTVTVNESDFLGTTDAFGNPICAAHPPSVANPCYVTVEVEYDFYTVIPWPLIPNHAHFDRSTKFRMFY